MLINIFISLFIFPANSLIDVICVMIDVVQVLHKHEKDLLREIPQIRTPENYQFEHSRDY